VDLPANQLGLAGSGDWGKRLMAGMARDRMVQALPCVNAPCSARGVDGPSHRSASRNCTANRVVESWRFGTLIA
jgi:hypothetical protein